MRVYFAAPYELRPVCLELLRDCARAGITSTSRWLEVAEDPNATWARRDLEDVARCDVLVALNPDDWRYKGTGGRHVELGYAIALSKPIVLAGVKSNIFHEVVDVHCAQTAVDIIAAVRLLADVRYQEAAC